eukprot:scaffold51722_cov63-Phaeocystis_antarctica.AAC.4
MTTRETVGYLARLIDLEQRVGAHAHNRAAVPPHRAVARWIRQHIEVYGGDRDAAPLELPFQEALARPDAHQLAHRREAAQLCH